MYFTRIASLKTRVSAFSTDQKTQPLIHGKTIKRIAGFILNLICFISVSPSKRLIPLSFVLPLIVLLCDAA